ncbi:ribonuclease P protein component 2 [Candidatus Woesearchaeota archaeon]|nr:ribonuclease P protein component 2 [Candidatus Woesearchaeota archaeon]
MKPLLPTLKEKKRYIGFEVSSDQPLSKQEIVAALNQGFRSYLGELGLAKAGVFVLRETITTKVGIVRVSTKYVNDVKAAMVLINKIGSKDVMFRTIVVSGTVKKTKQKVYGEAS